MSSPNRDHQSQKRPKSRFPNFGNDISVSVTDLKPFHTKLVEGIYERPVIVTILLPEYAQKKKLDENKKSNKFKTSNKRRKNKKKVNTASDSEFAEDSEEEIDENQDMVLNEKDQIKARLRFFFLKVNDVVTSKEAVHKIMLREYIMLAKVFLRKFGTESVLDYYQPLSISWWIKHFKSFLLVFDKPTGQLALAVDRKKIERYIKKKMNLHTWMVDAIGSTPKSSPGMERDAFANNHETSTYEVDLEGSFNSDASPFEQSHRQEDFPNSFSESEQESYFQNTNNFHQSHISHYHGGPLPSELPIVRFSPEMINPVISEANLSQTDSPSKPLLSNIIIEENNTDIEVEEKNPILPTESKEFFQHYREEYPTESFNHAHSDDYNSLLNGVSEQPPSSVSRIPSAILESIQNEQETKDEIATIDENIKDESSVTELLLPPQMSESDSNFAEALRDSLKVFNGNNRSSNLSNTRKSVTTGKRGSVGKNLPQITTPATAKTNELLAVAYGKPKKRSSVTDNQDELSPSQGTLPKTAPSPNKSRSSVGVKLPSVSVDPQKASLNRSLSQSTQLTHRRESNAPINQNGYETVDSNGQMVFPFLQAMGSMGSSASIDPNRPISPFLEQTKDLRGSARVAVDIIHKARKSVSADTNFQVRKVSQSEMKLLTSPFAKKLYIEPPADPLAALSLTHK